MLLILQSSTRIEKQFWIYYYVEMKKYISSMKKHLSWWKRLMFPKSGRRNSLPSKTKHSVTMKCIESLTLFFHLTDIKPLRKKFLKPVQLRRIIRGRTYLWLPHFLVTMHLNSSKLPINMLFVGFMTEETTRNYDQ